MSEIQMPSLSNADFLRELEDYIKAGNGASPIHVTHKRFSPQATGTISDLSSNVVDHPPQFEKNTTEYPILVRAKYGKDKKLTTAVAPQDLSEFWGKYSLVLKSGFSGLQKNKSKAKK